jgi:hypothetical protein
MKPALQRRMAMSRRQLKRLIRVEPPTRQEDAPRPLTDAEQQGVLEHDVERLPHKDGSGCPAGGR